MAKKSVEEIAYDIRKMVDGIENSISYVENFNNENNKTWAWYQENEPNKLEVMAVHDPKRFKTLYFEEYGVNPE